MNFSHPTALFLLVLPVLFVMVAVYNFKRKKAILADFISATAYRHLGKRGGGEIDFFKTTLVTLALVCFILALAGPQWGEKFESMDIKGIEMIFLLDTSTSMNAEDLKPNRLETAKQLLVAIPENLKTDYISLVNFAGTAYVQCPLTIDYDAFKLLTEASLISPAEEQGTDFSGALSLALKSFSGSKGGRKLVILVTDGEDQEKEWQNFIAQFNKEGIIVFTVGVGAVAGAPIPVKDSEGNITGWKKDKQGNIVKTKLDENALIRIASDTGGQYFRLTDAAGIDDFVDNLKTFERTVLNKKVKLKKIKRFHYPLFLGIILFLVELILTERKLSWKKKTAQTGQKTNDEKERQH